MKTKQIRLGDLLAVRSDLGLNFYKISQLKWNDIKKEYILPKIGIDAGNIENLSSEDFSKIEPLLWLNEIGTLSLHKWLDDLSKNNLKKEHKNIEYRDRSYLDKRRILRQLSLKDEIAAFLDILTDDIYAEISTMGNINFINNIIDINSVEFWDIIKDLLIDGYLAFEIIFNDNKKPIRLDRLDPISLIIKIEDGKKIWIQNPENENTKRILFDNQVIYLIYSKSNSYNSYVEEIKESYERFKLIESAIIFKNTTGIVNDFMNIENAFPWINKALHKAARISESIFDTGINTDRRYNKFVSRIVDTFKKELIEKLIELNK
jgi:hypothetical protein